MIKLAAPTRKGYVFKGWYRDKKCTRKVTSIKKGSTGKNHTVCKMEKEINKSKMFHITEQSFTL